MKTAIMFELKMAKTKNYPELLRFILDDLLYMYWLDMCNHTESFQH